MGEIEAALLHPALPIVRPDLVRHMEDRARGIERRDRRGLVRHPVVRPRQREGVRREPPVHELVLLVLHEHEAAVARVVQDAAVVGDQRGLGLVRAAPDHDRSVPRESAAGEGVGADQLHGHADRGQVLGHPVRSAPHVADPGQRRQRDPGHADLGGRGVHHGARPDVRVGDHDQRALAGPAVGPPADRGGAELVDSGPDAGGERHGERDAFRLVLALEGEALGRGGHCSRRPAARHREPDARDRGTSGPIGDGHGELSRGASTVRGPHDEIRAHLHVERTRDQERPPDLADRLVAVAVGDLAPQGDGRAGDGQPGHHFHRRWLERQPAPLGRHAAPVVQRPVQGGPGRETGAGAQEIRPGARRVPRDGEREPAGRECAGSHRRGGWVDPLDAPTQWRGHIDSVERRP